MNSGIYFIKCIKNGYVYIGSSINIKRRIACHINKLKNNRHINKILQKDFNDFGEDCFIFRKLEYCNHKELLAKEQYWESKIKKSYCQRKEYEINPSQKVIDNFNSKIILLNNGCWKLNMVLRDNGYQYICASKGIYLLAHRLSYWIFKDKNILGQNVCHSCDNKYCVNPDHLFLGSCHDNHIDRANKGIGFILNKKIATKIRNIYRDYKNKKYIYEFLQMIGLNITSERSELVNKILRNQSFYDEKYIPIEKFETISKDKIINIKKDFLTNNFSIKDLSEKYNLKYMAAWRIIRNVNWKNIS